MPIVMLPVSGDPKVTHLFWCPGCKCSHHVGPGWTFDGNVERPTVTPSILVQTRDAVGAKRCHLFVRDGSLVFLGDCTHELAGQTVPMVEP